MTPREINCTLDGIKYIYVNVYICFVTIFFFLFEAFAWKMSEARWNHASFTLFLHLRRYSPISSRADGQSSDGSAHYTHLQRVDCSWCNFLRCVRNESPYVKRNNAREDRRDTHTDGGASGVLCADRWFRIIIAEEKSLCAICRARRINSNGG